MRRDGRRNHRVRAGPEMKADSMGWGAKAAVMKLSAKKKAPRTGQGCDRTTAGGVMLMQEWK